MSQTLTDILVVIAAVFLVWLVIRLFRNPIRWILKLLLNTAIGFAALFLLNSPKRYTVSLTIYSFCSQKKSDWNLLFANITLIFLPIIAIYCFLQKYIVSGMTAGAVKG